MGPIRRKKWLEIAAKYEKMTPAEQERLQARMREWVQLTPEQRRTARDSYARAKKLDSGQKSARWEQYQSLPEEEKQKLADKAKTKKNVVNLPRPKSGRDTAGPAQATAPVLPSAPMETSVAPTPTTLPEAADMPSTTAPAVPMLPGTLP